MDELDDESLAENATVGTGSVPSESSCDIDEEGLAVVVGVVVVVVVGVVEVVVVVMVVGVEGGVILSEGRQAMVCAGVGRHANIERVLDPDGL